MVALHSHEFFSGRVTTSPVTNLYTVPAGKLIVVKHMSIQNVATSTKTCIIVIDGAWILLDVTLPAVSVAGSNYQWSGWAAISEGKTIQCGSSAGSTWDLNISGYLYFV